MYGINKDCPIRITSVVSYSGAKAEEHAARLVTMFGWRIHSRSALTTVTNKVFSILLFNTSAGIDAETAEEQQW